jgi:hypothetical protein
VTRVISTALQAHLDSDLITLTRCFELTKANGTVIRLTSHDVPLSVNGFVYTPYPIEFSAISTSSDLSVDNADVILAIDEQIIKSLELKSGDFNESKFNIFIVNWQSPADGVIALKKGTLGDIEITQDQSVKIQLRGLTQALQRPVVEKYSATCRATFGSKRCGFANFPTKIRRQNAKLTTWNWFLDPVSSVVTPAITNASFDAGLTGWIPLGTSSWSTANGFTPFSGSLYTVSAGGVNQQEHLLTRDFSVTSLGMTNANVDSGNYSFDLTVQVSSNNSNGNSLKLQIEQLDSNGVAIRLEESEYFTPEYQKWEGVGLTVFVLPSCRTIRVLFYTQTLNGTSSGICLDNVNIRFWNNAQSSFKMYRTMRIPAYHLSEQTSLTNNGFDSDATIANSSANNVTGWSKLGGSDFFSTTASSGSVLPLSNSYFLKGGDDGSSLGPKTYSLSQEKTFSGQMATGTPDNIAAGWYVGVAKVKTVNLDATSYGKIKLQFLNASNTVLATAETSQPVGDINSWRDLRVSLKVPVGATKTKITISAVSGSGSSQANVGFDDVNLYHLITAFEHESDVEIGKLSSDINPDLPIISGDYGIDGDFIVQNRALVFNYGVVTTSIDKRNFKSTDINETTQLMYSARILWLSGLNAGRNTYVRIFDNTTKLIKSYADCPYVPQVGDKFVYSVGCDKTITRCSEVFSNASNFRGEPYLPGATKVISFFSGESQ